MDSSRLLAMTSRRRSNFIMPVPLDGPPSAEGLMKREFIHVLQSAAGGHALGQTGDLNAGGPQEIRQIVGGGFSFHIRAEGDDDLLRMQILGALQSGLNVQI